MRLKPPSETGTWTLQDNRWGFPMPSTLRHVWNSRFGFRDSIWVDWNNGFIASFTTFLYLVFQHYNVQCAPCAQRSLPQATTFIADSTTDRAHFSVTLRAMPRFPLPRIRSGPSQVKDPNVFTNSLSKTLEAHRSSNRAGLIRKVYSRDPSPGLFRPYIPPENRAGYQQPAPAPPSPPKPRPKLNDSLKSEPNERLSKVDHLGRICRADLSIDDPLGQRPWLKYIQPSEVTGDAFAFLDAEIRALSSYLSPSPEEQKKTDQIYEELVSLLETVVPSPPERIGLRRIGLAPTHSAIELMVLVRDTQRSPEQIRKPSASRPQIRRAHVGLLEKVNSALMSSLAFEKIASPTYRPCLEVRHKSTGLKVRMTCGQRRPAIFEYLQDYLIEYPALRPLYLASRALIEARCTHLHIDSNALILLVVAFLKMNHGRFTGPLTLAHQWMAFLKLYGSDVDLSSVGVALDPPGFFGSRVLRANENGDAEPAYLRGQRSLMRAKHTAQAHGNLQLGQSLCIQDPTHFMQDLGRSVTRIREVQSELKTAHGQLSEACEKWEGPSDDASLLATALRANFDGFEQLRRQITHGPWAETEKASNLRVN